MALSEEYVACAIVFYWQLKDVNDEVTVFLAFPRPWMILLSRPDGENIQVIPL